MAISSKQIGWSNESNLLWNIWKQLQWLTGVAKTGGGSQGPQGNPGPQGEQGVQGEQGTTGAQGAALIILGSYPDLAAFLAGAGGLPGNPGDAWIILSDGSLYVWNTDTNLWNDVGDLLGPQGPQGQQGVQGEQGIQGQQGTQGTQGDKGDTGSQGVQGEQGIQGVKGDDGAQGIQGDQGIQGTAGNSVTILGSYADYAAFLAGAGGSPGAAIGDSWILLSDGSLYTWNGTAWFDAGDIKGPQGDQGPQGNTGATGATGATGSQGIQGIQGIQGNTGAKGDTGDQGIQGIQGIQGPQGIQGVKGDTGAAGTIGFFAQTSDSVPVTATTAETTIIGTGVGGLTVPANAFQIGDSFQAALDGVITCISSATLHIHVRTLTGVLLADTGIIDMAAATSKNWIMNLYFTIRTLGGTTTASISSGGLFSYIRNGGTQFEGFVLSTVNNTTFDTTVDNTLVITAQWNTTNAGNSILTRNFTLAKIY